MRRVKLFDTGQVVDKSDVLFQAPNKKWFSSYDAYLEYDLDNQMRLKCISKMYDFMGYKESQAMSTLFYKRLKEWRDGYSYSVILKAMNISADSIDFAIRTKRFDNENSKLKYIMAIINNQLNDALKLTQSEHRVNKVDNNSNLDMYVEGMEHICGNTKANDVSHLAGDI